MTTITDGLSLCDRGPVPVAPPGLNAAVHALFSGQPGEATALIVTDGAGAALETWTYAALRDAVRRAAGGLRAAGLAPGDRVMLRMGDDAGFPILFLAAIAAGGIAAPTSAMLTAPEASRLAAAVSPAFVCLGRGFAIEAPGARLLQGDSLRAVMDGPPVEPAAAQPDDPAYLVFTSGSSGRPKGVLHAHRAVWARRMMWRGWYGLTAADRVLHAGAFNWTYTLGAGLLDPWGAGATAIVRTGERAPGDWPRIAEAQGATLFAATPGVYRQTLKYGQRVGAGFAGLRHGLTAGEKLPGSLRAAWEAETGKPLFEALGMSELSTYVSSGPDAPPRDGFIGPPQPGRRVAVLRDDADVPAPLGEEGRLAVDRRDPGLMLGYWRDAGATAAMTAGAWFVTGDRAAMAADGYLAYRGRRDDLMNAGGFRVAPQEVEDALLAHPAVREAAVAEHEVRADVTVVAAWVAADGVDEATLADWCAERLAAYKRPRRFVFLDALPRTATGKVMRRALSGL